LEEKLKLNEKLSDTLRFAVIHEKALDFTDFLDNLSTSCEVCNRNPEFSKPPGHIGQTKFRKGVEENFFEE
jgi:hypothetical protein